MKKTLAALLSCLFLAAALPQPALYAAETDAPEDSRITGDVNGDGQLNAADIVLMQKWLLQVPDAVLADWQAGDCNADGRLDGLYLCRMRQIRHLGKFFERRWHPNLSVLRELKIFEENC